ncbi:hypothetical protein CY35_14G077600 [Sphagnum magellanicum]|nr:hypothetical protein CY35_14G077600 [Sphagnum magellanicum]
MAIIVPSSPPNSPKAYRKPTPMDPISANKVWKEHCDKCDVIPALQGPFQIDPRTNLGIVTRKEYEDAMKLMETLSPIKNPQMPPPDKYDLPLTVAQEIGWNTKPLVKKHPLFTFERNACEITLYAHKYFMSLGVNPFAKRKPVVGQIGKNKEPTIGKGSPINVIENNKAK